ncbi:low affinity immunoglobulin gamma Fc region receptor III-B isoform X1 [Canis lupus familiaris]|uniref:low affinity immunoglobulin gamma Fc region receptor III-B isoform X1 n=1 Tax=Canis lupus familiaris TaxID=9615 RepID=UPI0018F7DF94|nr:low affinity immunoglobulin gamma Fc region receptor III-B isoform X1 [Canis lupus familiaris]XP_038304530.1 low affinity immunoglobulin gamma Fc region receptor III-B isoform X1 [Canis lupus familiaris]
MWQLVPSTALLLLVSAGTQAADVPKAVVVLEPKWNRVLTMDSVTLKCQGDHLLRDNYTWLHNGRPISNQISTYIIKNASIKNSGEYRCQTDQSKLSDPVQLEVHTGWLLLQVPRLVFQEGELIQLKCHSWKNTPVRNVQYFQNGRGKKFFYNNSEYHIPAATSEHNGSYFCRGIIGKKNESSEAVNIIIQDDQGSAEAMEPHGPRLISKPSCWERVLGPRPGRRVYKRPRLRDVHTAVSGSSGRGDLASRAGSPGIPVRGSGPGRPPPLPGGKLLWAPCGPRAPRLRRRHTHPLHHGPLRRGTHSVWPGVAPSSASTQNLLFLLHHRAPPRGFQFRGRSKFPVMLGELRGHTVDRGVCAQIMCVCVSHKLAQ